MAIYRGGLSNCSKKAGRHCNETNSVLRTRPYGSVSASVTAGPAGPSVTCVFRGARNTTNNIRVAELAKLLSVGARRVPIILGHNVIRNVTCAYCRDNSLSSAALVGHNISGAFTVPFVARKRNAGHSIQFRNCFRMSDASACPFTIGASNGIGV